MEMLVVILVIAALLVVIAFSDPLAERLGLPVSVVLAFAGITIGAGASFFWFSTWTNALNTVALAILHLPISSEVFLYCFLPTLVFQVSLSINLRRMLDDWVPILVLAVVAVAVATVVVGFALHPFSTMSLAACLLIGAIVSTTDPSAVVGIFRATPAPQRLARIVEGESLLNDAAAIALFAVFLDFVTVGAQVPTFGTAAAQFPWLLFGGAAFGWLVARIGVQLIGWLGEYPLGQISVSFALPYVSFILTDELLQASGVVAVVAAGLTLNVAAPGRMTPPALQKLRETWELLAYWSGGLIFMLAAILIPRLMAGLHAFDLLLIAIVVIAALVARAIILFGLLPLLTFARVSPKVERSYRLAILWGGLRGAVTLALALAVTEHSNVPAAVKHEVGIVATGFALFTLLVQGTTLRRVITLLGLDRLSPMDKALSRQVVAVALQSVREVVDEALHNVSLQPGIVRSEHDRFSERLNTAVAKADEAKDILDKDRVTLSLVALAAHERDLILGAFRDQLMTTKLADRMLDEVDRLIEGVRTEGRGGYRAAVRQSLRPPRTQGLAEILHNNLDISAPLEGLVAGRLEYLVANGQVLQDLHRFVDTRILRIHGQRVADVLHELINWRLHDSENEKNELRQQYPGYTEEVERRLIRRMTLQKEEAEYDQLTSDGLIGPELRSSLMADVERRRAELRRRPKLDLALQKSVLAKAFPLFEGLSLAQQTVLITKLRTVYAAPGHQLLGRDDRPRKVWFVASGTVEVDRGGELHLLGQGEMFGQLIILLGHPHGVIVRAITKCTLLTLEAGHFLHLLHTHEPLRRALAETAARRNLVIDVDNLPELLPRAARPTSLWQRLLPWGKA